MGQEDKQKKGLRERMSMGGWEEKRIERESLPSVMRRLGRGFNKGRDLIVWGGGGQKHYKSISSVWAVTLSSVKVINFLLS